MNGAPRAERRPFERFVRFAASLCLTAAFVLLPALVAGSRIALPPTAGEVARLRAALATTGEEAAKGTVLARGFHAALLWPQPAAVPDAPEAQAALVGRARLAEVVAVLGLSLLLYLALLLARGRVQALVGCACFALVPPLFREGHLLRPEALAAAFVLFATVLLQCLAQPVRVLRLRGPVRQALQVAGLSVCASIVLALAIGTLPSLGECLLVPGVVLVLASLQLGLRARRVVRRGGWLRVPIRAINGRLLPWTLVTLLGSAVTVLVLRRTLLGPVEALPTTASAVALLPAEPFLHASLLGLAVLGSLAGVLRTGLRFGRGGRIGADVVLLVFCAVHLAAALGEPPGRDLLPAAPALCVVFSEGLLALLHLIRRRGWKRKLMT